MSRTHQWQKLVFLSNIIILQWNHHKMDLLRKLAEKNNNLFKDHRLDNAVILGHTHQFQWNL